jgi:hypothetical protein
MDKSRRYTLQELLIFIAMLGIGLGIVKAGSRLFPKSGNFTFYWSRGMFLAGNCLIAVAVLLAIGRLRRNK